MKFVAKTKALHEAFQYAGSVITSSVIAPLYQNVKLEASPDGVSIAATDLEVELKINVRDPQVEEEGALLVPQSTVSSILGATLDEEVTLESTDDVTELRCSDGKFRLLSEPVEDYQEISVPQDEGFVEIDPEVLAYMVKRTAFAAAEERGRYALNGVLVVVDGDSIEMVAADGARLALVKKKVSNPQGLSLNCIVNKKAMEQAARLALMEEGPVKLRATERLFAVESPMGFVCSLLVEGNFPDYKAVVPTEPSVRVELPRAPLANAVRRASFLTTRGTRAVDFQFSEGTLTIRSESPDLGQSELSLKVEYEGEGAEISFNPEFLEEMLQLVERDTVKLEFTDKGSPCVIKSGFDFVYVVSPVVREDL